MRPRFYFETIRFFSGLDVKAVSLQILHNADVCVRKSIGAQTEFRLFTLKHECEQSKKNLISQEKKRIFYHLQKKNEDYFKTRSHQGR